VILLLSLLVALPEQVFDKCHDQSYFFNSQTDLNAFLIQNDEQLVQLDWPKNKILLIQVIHLPIPHDIYLISTVQTDNAIELHYKLGDQLEYIEFGSCGTYGTVVSAWVDRLQPVKLMRQP
jgi:hypothetical protein